MSFYVAFKAERFYGIIGVRGTVNSKIFIHFLSKVLKCIQKLGPEEMKELILVLDNASTYKTKMVSKFVENSKIMILTIPPYKPSLNPAEKFILEVKSKIRQKRRRGQ